MNQATELRPGLWSATKQVISEFMNDDAFTLAGALAYYTALSLAPLLTLVIWAARFVPAGMREKLTSHIGEAMGQQAGGAIDAIMKNAHTPGANLAGAVSFAILIFSATAVFVQLQWSMNHIWNVKPNPKSSWWDYLRPRLLSLGMILGILLFLLLSLIVSGVLSTMAKMAGDAVPAGTMIWQIVNGVASTAIFVVLFAAMFKFVPDVDIPWKDVWGGAALTAVCFTVGKYLIGLYLGHSSFQSSYGAAGSLIALLVWVYYSSLILFMGVEVTQVWAMRHGTQVRPNRYAVAGDAPS